MLQRIQTIYLFLALVCTSIIFYSPIFTVENQGLSYKLDVMGLHLIDAEGNKDLANYVALIVITAAISVLTLLTIFRFKVRPQQIKMGQFALLLNTVLLSGIFFYSEKAMDALKELFSITGELKPNYSLAAILPILSMIFIFLAIKAIQKDEALVRAADRIR